MNWTVRIVLFFIIYIPSSLFFHTLIYFMLWVFGRCYSWNVVYLAQVLAFLPFLIYLTPNDKKAPPN